MNPSIFWKDKRGDAKTTNRAALLTQLLLKLNKKGNFIASILAAESGLVMAEAGNEESKKTIAMAAMASLVHTMSSRIKDLLKMGDLKDIVIRAKENKVMFKTIKVNNHTFILGILAPQLTKVRENLIRSAVNKIEQIFA